MLLSSLTILLINISVMMLPVDGLSGTSIIWMIQIFLYMVLVFFSLKRKLDLTTYMIWTDSVNLINTSCFLHGPFYFDSQSDIISTFTK